MPILLQLAQSYSNPESINYKVAYLREQMEQGLLNLGDLAYADQGFEAEAARGSTAELLQVPEGAPILKVTSITYTSKDVPVEFRRVCYRGDKYRFTIRRRYRETGTYR